MDHAAAAGGFRPPARYSRIDGPPDSDLAGFWAEIRTNLLGAEVVALRSANYFVDLHRVMAPLIRAWNYEAPVERERVEPAILADDGATEIVPERTVVEVDYEPLPPPAEAGPEVLERVDAVTKVWLRAEILFAPLRIEGAKPAKKPEDDTPEGKSSGRAGTTPGGTPDEAAPSTRKPRSRPSRPSSTKP